MATIKSKIIVNVIILLLTIVGIVGTNYYNLHELRNLQDEGSKRATEAVAVAAAAGAADKIYGVIADAIISREIDSSAREWAEVKKELTDDITACEKLAESPKEKEQVAAAKKSVEAIVSLYEGTLLPLLKTDSGFGAWDQIKDIDHEINKHKVAIEKDMAAVEKEVHEDARKADEEFDADIKKTIAESLIIGLLGILLQAGLATWLLRTILRPVNAMVSMLKDMAEGDGDLTVKLADDSKDEIAVASRYFNLFIEKLRNIIGQVAQASQEVASASNQLHATAEQMATGVEEVVAQANTVATAGEEMSATSNDIAQNCQLAAEGSRQASETAVSGAKVVDETIAVMSSIAKRVQNSAVAVESLGDRSDQIGAIVGTIEDIADQTNLLALNAAIEAARAGEQGRGFAVVADEVRALAERTTRATREIGEMIKAIQTETKGAVIAMEEGVKEVAIGSEKAANSGRALEQILDQINAVTIQIAQVATAAEEQTATTSEISNNMQQITEVVSQTASGAQESAAASNQLSALAEDLRRIVGQFKL